MNNTILDSLSEEERKIALQILEEYAKEGNSSKMNTLMQEDWDEIPVDIDTFMHDRRYLGNGLTDAEGRFTVFPYWENMLKDVFPTNTTTKYNTIVLTGCLTGDVEVPLLNGKTLSMKDLANIGELDEYVYSFDVESNKYVPGHLIKAFTTGIKPVYKITLDNSESFKATSNHKFLTRDKRWKSIDSGLSVDDSLMPFNTRLAEVTKDRPGYEQICQPKQDGTYEWEFTHRLVMSWKRGAYKGVVHHKDFDKRNNDPRNLLLTDWTTHRMYHAKCGGDRWREFNEKRRLGLIDPETERRILDGGLKGCKNRWADPEQHERISEITTNRMNNGLAKQMSDVTWQGDNREANLEKAREKITRANKDPETINSWQINKGVKVANIALNEFGELSESTYEQTKLKHNMRTGYPSFKKILARIDYDDLLNRALNYNHRIVSIEFVGLEPVYDLTVEKHHNFALASGIVAHNSIGIGKSTVAVICQLYLLYRLLCLRDPYVYYGLQPIDKITISFMNITLDAARGVSLDKFNQLLLSSEWFLSHGKMNGISNLDFVPDKHIEIVAGSSNNQIIGRCLYGNFSDEVNFSASTANVEKLKKKMLTLISQIDARMKSRFLRGTYLPTLNIIASSKASDQSFLDEYINSKRKNESSTTLIVDEPQWVVDSRKDSPIKFYVAVGNKFLANELLPKDAPPSLADEYRAKGYQVLEVPIGYYENFQDNIDGALTDIAGIATASSLKYISGIRWNEIKSQSYSNPFTQEIITVGNSKDDFSQYSDYFDLSRVSPKLRSRPMYVHLDMSLSGDKTGIAGVYIMGKRVGAGTSDKELYYQVAFSVSVKAPKGYQVSFEKNRSFIRWLKKQGFKIRGISADTYQSAQIQQQLTADGFDVSTISVDRLDHDTKQCLPYAYLKSAIYDRRLEVYADCPFLTEEVLGLEREADGHIEHPAGGTMGSKDAIDAVCGSLWNASQHADEYGYEFGESAENILDINEEEMHFTENDIRERFNQDLIERHRRSQRPPGVGELIEEDLSVFDGVMVW